MAKGFSLIAINELCGVSMNDGEKDYYCSLCKRRRRRRMINLNQQKGRTKSSALILLIHEICAHGNKDEVVLLVTATVCDPPECWRVNKYYSQVEER